MVDSCLKTENISKRFGKKQILYDVTDEFGMGFHALLGPNGAGKSTYLNCICGCLKPSWGDIIYQGQRVNHMPVAYRKDIRVLFQKPPLFANYTVKETMIYGGMLCGLTRAEQEEQTEALLIKVGLENEYKKKVYELSGGMKQRLAIAQTLLGNAKLLLLDEPTVGLDIGERDHFRQIMMEIKTNHIVIMSTHILSDIEQIADEIHILSEGHICGRLNLRNQASESRSSMMIRKYYLDALMGDEGTDA